MSEEKQMRALDDDERKMTEARLASNKNEMKCMMFAKHQSELMLSEGIEADCLAQNIKYKKQLSMLGKNMKELAFAIETSEKQLRDGVEITHPTAMPKTVTLELPNDANYYEIVDMLEDKGCVVINKEVKEK